MSIAYYELEPDVPPPIVPSATTEEVVTEKKNFFENETSECNYLVFIFIVGVLFLAFTDAMKR